MERCASLVCSATPVVEFLRDLDHGGALVEVDGHDRTGGVALSGTSQDAGAQNGRASDLRGRDAQRDGRLVAAAHQGRGRAALAIHPLHRSRPDDPRGGGDPAGQGGRRHRAGADGWHKLPVHVEDADAAERHTVQYFEIFGNRAIYKDGWMASCLLDRIIRDATPRSHTESAHRNQRPTARAPGATVDDGISSPRGPAPFNHFSEVLTFTVGIRDQPNRDHRRDPAPVLPASEGHRFQVDARIGARAHDRQRRRCAVTQAGDATTNSSANDDIAWGQIALGVALLQVARRTWRNQLAHGIDSETPKWMTGVDALTPVNAAGLGLLLAALNPMTGESAGSRANAAESARSIGLGAVTALCDR
jgi:hypothetical protein